MGEKKKQAHQALYRKYRSKSLDEVLGQDHITKTLASAIKQGKISHAYLFTGPKGVGKTSIARILAHEINNLPYEDEKTHLDIIEIDAASNRRIDDIRDLRDKVHIAPVSAQYKVYIIDEVHMLTNESFNALLKTLEEPPAHVVFILATTEVHKLPATIISRTQRHSFRAIKPEQAAEHLKDIAKKEGISIDDAALELIAEHGDGSFRDSISLLDQLSSSGDAINVDLVELLLGLAPKETLHKLLDAAKTGNSKDVIALTEQLIESGLTPSGVAAQLLKLLRDSAKNGENSQQTVQLMNELLAVHNALYPQLKLETTLLGLAAPTSPAQPIDKPPVTQPVKTMNADVAAQTKPLAEPVAKTKQTSNADDPPVVTAKRATKDTADVLVAEHWQDILELTKQKNNPLYTVLRLAIPEQSGEELTLAFNFAFHQKKVEEPRHKKMIGEIVQEATGASFVIKTIVDKTKAVPATETPAPPKDPAHASLIAGVQDIMGGGEIVNV